MTRFLRERADQALGSGIRGELRQRVLLGLLPLDTALSRIASTAERRMFLAKLRSDIIRRLLAESSEKTEGQLRDLYQEVQIHI